jgi:hypothetical protein
MDGIVSAMKKIIRFILDAVMTAAFLVLMDPRSVGGIGLHEWAGLAICVFFIVHKVFNWKWIRDVTKSLFGRIPWRTRLNYLLDVALLVGMVSIVWSGMKIARTIDFTWLPMFGGRGLWRTLHASASMLVLAVAGVHLGLHWDWIRARFVRKGGREAVRA